jgi:FkbM family methyltransferase
MLTNSKSITPPTHEIWEDGIYHTTLDALQHKVLTTQGLVGQMDRVDKAWASVPAPAVPTIALPSWAKWCLVRPCDGNKMFYMAVYSENDIVSREICSKGVWEHCDAKKFAGLAATSLISAGKATPLAIDIGGNIGYYSLLLANGGWNVVTAEPLPMNTDLIEASLKQNPDMKSRIHLHKVGLAAHGGAQCAVISGNDNVGDGNTYCATTPAEVDDWIAHQKLSATIHNAYQLRGKFTMSTLDDLIHHDPFLSNAVDRSIDFVKMDVEGFEGEVIKGGPSLLSDHKPIKIQSEVWRVVQKITPVEFLSMFASAGYAISEDKVGTDWACDKADDVASLRAKVDMMFASKPQSGAGAHIDVQMCLPSSLPTLTRLGSDNATRTKQDFTVHDPKVHTLMRIESHGAVHKLHYMQ